MEYMNFDAFMGKMVSRFIGKAIEKKTGVRPDFSIEELKLQPVSRRASGDTIEFTLRVVMEKEDLNYLIEEVTN